MAEGNHYARLISDSSPSTATASGENIFIDPWSSENYDWPNIKLDPTSIKAIVTRFKFMINELNFKNLTVNIKNNSILRVKRVVNGNLVLDYFDYSALNVNGQNLTKDEKDAILRSALGPDVKVVTLLIGRPKTLMIHVSNPPFIGICYDSCDADSNISHTTTGASNQNRVLCTKRGVRKDVKIAFFPTNAFTNVHNPLDFVFYEGGVTFDKEGVFLEFSGSGKLLKKSGNGFNLFDTDFSNGAIVASKNNKMYQYNDEVKLTGYAFGNIQWDLNALPPTESLSSDDNFCVNFDLGSVSVENSTDEDKISKCSKMYYTVSPRDQGMFEQPEITKLFDSATGGIGVGIPPVARKIDFIKKEGYTENVPPEVVNNCTLYKFKCEVSGGVFCIIEVILCNNFIRRIRIYKFYTKGKPVDDSDKKRVIKKEGLFVLMHPNGKIKSVFVCQELPKPNYDLYGMIYNITDEDELKVTSEKLIPIDASKAMAKENTSGVTKMCQLLDDSTGDGVESSIGAAAAC